MDKNEKRKDKQTEQKGTSKSSRILYSDTGYLCLMPIPLCVAVVGTILIFRTAIPPSFSRVQEKQTKDESQVYRERKE